MESSLRGKKVTHYEAAKTFFFMALVAIIIFAGSTLFARADDLAAIARAEFFKNAKKARLANGKTFNCCEPAEAVGVRITGSTAPHFYGTIIALHRHRTAKLGQTLAVEKDRLVVWPTPPSDMGDVFFLQSAGTYVFCFFPQAGG